MIKHILSSAGGTAVVNDFFFKRASVLGNISDEELHELVYETEPEVLETMFAGTELAGKNIGVRDFLAGELARRSASGSLIPKFISY